MTGLDFQGRYYGSALGRFTSPDWSTSPQAVPYSNLEDPQSLNLYSYVRNNPLAHPDPDGHCPICVVAIEDFIASPEGQEVGEWISSNTSQIVAGAGAIFTGAVAALGGGREPGGYVPGGLTDANGNSVFASKTAQQTQTAAAPERTANDNLRRDENGKAVPDPEAAGQKHTQLGTRDSKSQPGQRYKQTREFDENGKPVKDIDFTDHGRKDHANPHEHPYDPTTGKRGPQQPLNKCGSNQTCP